MDARENQNRFQKNEPLSLGGVARRVGGVLANLAPNSRPNYRDRPEELSAPRFSPEAGAADIPSPSFSPEPGAADIPSPSFSPEPGAADIPSPSFSPEPSAAETPSPSFSPEPGAADAASPSEGTWYSDPTGADIHSLDVHREKCNGSEAPDVDLLALADRQARSLDALRKKKSA